MSISQAISHEQKGNRLVEVSGKIYAAVKKFENELSGARSELCEIIDANTNESPEILYRLDRAISELEKIKDMGVTCLTQIAEKCHQPQREETSIPKKATDPYRKKSAIRELQAWALASLLAGTMLLLLLSMTPR